MMEPFFTAPVVTLAVIGGIIWKSYNRLSALDQRCETAFSDIDVQLKHRHNVIPGLVETVRGYVGHERALIEKVADSRVRALSARTHEDILAAESRLGSSITQLMTAAESYPDLQASGHFRDLRMEIADAENKITGARRFYNLAVEEFNTSLRQFPGNLIGDACNLVPRKNFDLGVERVLIDEPLVFKF